MSDLERTRRARGWSREQLAARAGVSAATVARIERGIVAPHPATRAALATVLGIAPDDVAPDDAPEEASVA